MSGIADLIPASRWALLSEVGQAYGSVAALISAAALAGVALSVDMQARTTRIAALQGLRTRQFEIARLVIENPALAQVEGEVWRGHHDDFRFQSHVVINQWIAHWLTMYDLGLIDQDTLRGVVRRLFRGQLGRSFWIDSRSSYWAGRPNGRLRSVLRLMDEELRAAEATPPRTTVNPVGKPRFERKAAAAFGGAAAIGLGILLHRRRQSSRRDQQAAR
ncbi:DUF6082 family protein [Nonomuraea turcica]|uniref:DUF6082 family protein n=1 Tax=Nonomuraea sp. G32 TaxID=3067274 RepID=UPI00273B0C5C|nr:DUF6082 family protein [Nonomuraea sp. G32]MDP4500621.1 DUF6082 family protein [Nonomuraea sp. G32]